MGKELIADVVNGDLFYIWKIISVIYKAKTKHLNTIILIIY